MPVAGRPTQATAQPEAVHLQPLSEPDITPDKIAHHNRSSASGRKPPPVEQ